MGSHWWTAKMMCFLWGMTVKVIGLVVAIVALSMNFGDPSTRDFRPSNCTVVDAKTVPLNLESQSNLFVGIAGVHVGDDRVFAAWIGAPKTYRGRAVIGSGAFETAGDALEHLATAIGQTVLCGVPAEPPINLFADVVSVTLNVPTPTILLRFDKRENDRRLKSADDFTTGLIVLASLMGAWLLVGLVFLAATFDWSRCSRSTKEETELEARVKTSSRPVTQPSQGWRADADLQCSGDLQSEKAEKKTKTKKKKPKKKKKKSSSGAH